jgi:hypothetical protein
MARKSVLGGRSQYRLDGLASSLRPVRRSGYRCRMFVGSDDALLNPIRYRVEHNFNYGYSLCSRDSPRRSHAAPA